MSFPLGGGEFFEEVMAQEGDVVFAVRQGRHLQGDDVQAVVQVLAEGPLLHFFFQVFVGGRQDSDVDGDFGGPADPEEIFFLEHPEQFHLHGRGHFGDFIQQNRAPGGYFQQPLFHAPGPGKGLFFVAEELVGQQLLCKGAAVDGQEALGGPGTQLVNGLGHQLLAGAGFSQDEHGAVGGGDLRDGGF
jgi:hypothetical protein